MTFQKFSSRREQSNAYLPIMISFRRTFQYIFGKMLSSTPELCYGGDLQDPHGLLQIGHGLLVDLVPLGPWARQVARDVLADLLLRGTVVFVATVREMN